MVLFPLAGIAVGVISEGMGAVFIGIGAGCGFGATGWGSVVFRREGSEAKKFVASGLVTISAAVVFLLLAALVVALFS